MQGIRRSLRVSCYEISQIPAEKTDYKFTRRAQVVNQEGIEDWLWSIHAALANPLPRSQALIWCPVPFCSDEEPEGCLCRCVRVTDEGDRPFLRTQAVIVAVRDVARAEADPMSLYDSDVWQQMSRKQAAPVEAVLQNAPSTPTHAKPSPEMATAVARALVNLPTQLVTYDLTNEAALALMRAALLRLGPRQIARASFAVGVPDGVDLPTNPAVIIRAREAEKQSTDTREADTDRGRSRADQGGSYVDSPDVDALLVPLDQRAREFMDRMAEVAQWIESNRLPALWRERWWNHCQDMITSADAARHAKHPARLLGRIQMTQEGLVSEINRHLPAQDAQRVSSVVREHTRALVYPARQRRQSGGVKFRGGWSPVARWGVITLVALLLIAGVSYAVWPLLFGNPASSDNSSTPSAVVGTPSASSVKPLPPVNPPKAKEDNHDRKKSGHHRS